MSTSLTRTEMVHALCAAVDAGRPEDFGAWFAEDATYTFGNGETLVGRPAVVAATAGAVDSLPWVRHTVDDVVEAGDRLFCRFLIATESASGVPLELPCMTVIRVGSGGITDYRVYMDIGPAFA